ncbi:MAG TPA: EAL domain-containing protein [Solirubrobacteraceae bacterium]|nr:EAL domain-containing protein [Solirubrobacteraceae bacterium]
MAALLVTGGTLGAVLGARSVTRTDVDRARLGFHLASAEIASTLELAIQHEEDLVVSGSAFAANDPSASPTAFDGWAESVHALRRYPELRNIGLVEVVPASRLPAFEARMRAHPLLALGLHTPGPREAFQVLPAGSRPFYCLATAGIASSLATYLPQGLDYCTLPLAKSLLVARDTGQSSYAPVVQGNTTTLGVQTPVYRGGTLPSTVAGRRRAFVGWLGELLIPQVVVGRALQGHPGMAVTFRYDASSSHVLLTSGRPPRGAQTARIDLHNGWTVQSFGGPAGGAILADGHAAVLLIGGALVSLLLGLLVYVLGTGRTRALALVREKTRELSHQALHVTLTGLPNRALVLDRAEQLLARAGRQPEIVAGALFIDVDGFKHVNDNLGHAAGDQVLKVVGERLQSVVREQDTVGRLGGDEFVVLVESGSRAAPLDVLADRLIEALRQPVELDDGARTFSFTASIGVAVGQYTTPDDLLRDADLALYAAKAAGKNRYALFDASMDPAGEGRLELEVDLSAAVWGEQFFLLYQPIFDLRRQRVIGAEALIRWRHPARDVVAPDEFIPLAEETGLIVPIGRWVLEEACRQAAAWKAEGREIGISVNVSAYQLGQEEFAEDVRRALQESGAEPSSLVLEITETTLMRDVTTAGERLQEVRALGVRIAIDDFGTGYASLAHLQSMPVDILKVDRSFVAALNDGGQSRELLEAILGVGQALSLTVVAEGIETPSQLAMLQEMGCELAQGFLLGKPGPVDVVERLPDSDPPSRPAYSKLTS